MENVVVMLKHYTHYENSVCTNIQLTLLFDNNVVVFLYWQYHNYIRKMVTLYHHIIITCLLLNICIKVCALGGKLRLQVLLLLLFT